MVLKCLIAVTNSAELGVEHFCGQVKIWVANGHGMGPALACYSSESIMICYNFLSH